MTSGTPSAEVDIDARLVRTLLETQHPDLADLPIEPTASGWDNAMFRLGEKLAIRLPRRALGADLIAHEQRWLPEIAQRLPLSVPTPLRIGSPGAGYPWRWSIVEWLPGISADVAPPAAEEAVVLANFLKALHRPAPSEAPRNPYRGVPLTVRAAVTEERLERLRRETSAITDGVERAWRQGLDAPIDVSASWIHGDLHARNVLVDEGRLSAVIDWGDMAQGDRATDLASIWLLLPDRMSRERAVAALGDVSEATRRRARGWAVFFGVVLLDTGRVNDPRNAALGATVLERVHIGP